MGFSGEGGRDGVAEGEGVEGGVWRVGGWEWKSGVGAYGGSGGGDGGGGGEL